MTAASPVVLILLGVAALAALVCVLAGLGRLPMTMEPPHDPVWTAWRRLRARRAARTAPADRAVEAAPEGHAAGADAVSDATVDSTVDDAGDAAPEGRAAADQEPSRPLASTAAEGPRTDPERAPDDRV